MGFCSYAAVLTLLGAVAAADMFNIECEREGACFCTSTAEYTFEFLCSSKNQNSFIIRVLPVWGKVEILCLDQANWDGLDLQRLDVGDIQVLDFLQCPVPSSGFADIMDRIGINSTQALQFDYATNFENLTLASDYFKGLNGLRKLILNNNELRNIDNNAFELLPELTVIELNENNVNLTAGLFKHNKKLQYLSLSQNKLSSIPLGLFDDIRALKVLYLWNNKLKKLNDNQFTSLTNLELLELGYNDLENLTEYIFSPLKNLKTISLVTNRLKDIPGNLFAKNSLLEDIHMNNNPTLTKLPNNLFANLSRLANIKLNDCKLKSLPSNLFVGSLHIQNISLHGNALITIPENVFQGLSELQNLDISYNEITSLPDNVFASLFELKTLNLEGNLITKVSKDLLRQQQKLEVLNLKSNRIAFIDIHAFRRISSLKQISLADNYFDLPHQAASLLNGNVNLEIADLSNNNITTITEDLVLTLVTLQYLDLSNNQISSVDFSQLFTSSPSIKMNLSYNVISTINFDSAEAIAANQQNLDAYHSYGANRVITLEGNPIACDCRRYDFVRYVERIIDPRVPTLMDVRTDSLFCAFPNDLVGFPVNKLRSSMLTCLLQDVGVNVDAPEGCAYGFRTWDKALIVNCMDANLTEVPKLSLPKDNFYNQTEVYLQNNLLTAGPRENMGYQNVTKMFLSYNNINELTWMPPKIKVLKLDHNNMSYLNYSTVAMLDKSATNVTLGNNPWNCDCSTVNLINFLVSNLAGKQFDAKDIICQSSKKHLIQLSVDDICPTYTAMALGLGISFALVALFFVALLAMYYRFEQEIKVWLFAHNLFMWCVTEEEIDKDKVFDAFISFSHKDEQFVLKELQPVLEDGPHPYKLCLHIRDWVAGEFITKQIVASVAESRRTIVVLSRNFLESDWGKMEFRTAHQQALQEGRARVILILYGDIDLDSDLDDELKAYIRTNTYVKWGDPWFWSKLRYALPHSRVAPEAQSQRNQNIMVVINDKLDKMDDRLDLMNAIPTTPNNGTTPPAVNVDPLLLKNNPLDFTSGKTLTPPAESGHDPLIGAENK